MCILYSTMVETSIGRLLRCNKTKIYINQSERFAFFLQIFHFDLEKNFLILLKNTKKTFLVIKLKYEKQFTNIKNIEKNLYKK